MSHWFHVKLNITQLPVYRFVVKRENLATFNVVIRLEMIVRQFFNLIQRLSFVDFSWQCERVPHCAVFAIAVSLRGEYTWCGLCAKELAAWRRMDRVPQFSSCGLTTWFHRAQDPPVYGTLPVDSSQATSFIVNWCGSGARSRWSWASVAGRPATFKLMDDEQL